MITKTFLEDCLLNHLQQKLRLKFITLKMQSSDFNNEKNTMKIDQKLKRKTNLEEFINSEATVKGKCCLINEQ